MLRRGLLFAFSLFLLQSCLTYYQRNIQYQEKFATHKYAEANELLDKNKFIQKDRNQLLYLLEKGVTLQMMERYEESNKYFEEAYLFVENFQHGAGRDALSAITNDMIRNYGGEDFERIFLHYYKAINYIMLGSLDEALVEIRRINIRLNEITDKYKSEKKYKRDAFANVLMGLAYEAAGDENNAFIAYRNAWEIYKDDYTEFFGFGAPEQLKKDIIRMAALNGFNEEKERFERVFNLKYENIPRHKKELVFLWHKGLGPVKDEWSINFIVVQGQGGLVMFQNQELGLNFSFYMRSQDEGSSLGDLKVVRVAFPKYSIRKEMLNGAMVSNDSAQKKVELLEDINEIAVKSLRDRMVRELSKTLLRTALKQASAYAARQENENLGAAVSIFNAATEKADTRNWQTLPAKIYYTRLPVYSDTSKIEVKTFKGNHSLVEGKEEVIVKGRLGFHLYHSISKESLHYHNPG